MIVWDGKGNAADLPAADDIVLLLFFTSSCGPCAALGERIDAWASGRRGVLACRIGADEDPAAAAAFGIFSVPAVLLFVRGKLTVRECGCFSLEEVFRKAERYAGLLG